jgi:hypothetical protein
MGAPIDVPQVELGQAFKVQLPCVAMLQLLAALLGGPKTAVCVTSIGQQFTH